jgi:AcrR family transcriptional regulator
MSATQKPRMRGPERRAQLLEVARQAFGRSGFHGVSMEDVAREAGVTKPIIYDHFDSKEALYLALIEADALELEDRVRSALRAPTGNRERIRAAYRTYFEFVDDHSEGFSLFLRESVSPTQLSPRVAQVRERILADVEELIVRGSGGRLSDGDAATVAVGLVAMVESGAQRTPGGEPEDRRRQADILARLAWRGIAGL